MFTNYHHTSYLILHLTIHSYIICRMLFGLPRLDRPCLRQFAFTLCRRRNVASGLQALDRHGTQDTHLYRVIRCHILDHSCSMFLDLERSRDPTHHSEKQHLELLQDCFQSLNIKFFEKSVNSICSWIVLCVVL